MKKILVICCAVLISAAFFYPKLYAEKYVPCIGEELEYDVSFLTFKLGKIRITTVSNTEYEGEKVIKTQVHIESNPNIPFVKVKAIFDALMDTSLTCGRYFESTVVDNDCKTSKQKIYFHYPAKQSLRIEKWHGNQKSMDTLLQFKGKILDGATLFFFARKYIANKSQLKIPTIMDINIDNTYLNFSGKIEKVENATINYPIKAYYLNGKADWKGIYGLGEKFEGWFSCDEARIPIKAKMNVYLGNVTLELKKWKRKDWKPPKYN